MAKKKKTTAMEETANPAPEADAMTEQPTKDALRVLVMDNGKTYRITGERGKYYLCGRTQFRKGNPHIVRTEEER